MSGKTAGKKATVPKLRFPEFRDAGPWEVVPLKKLASRRTERNRDGKVTRVLTNSAEHGVLDQRDYFEKDVATQGRLDSYLIVHKGDFVYNPRTSSFAPVGPISRNNTGKGVVSPLYLVFRFRNSNTDFYAHYFKSHAWHSYLRKVGSTGARYGRLAVSNSDFMAMPLPVPLLEEQQKIADCLSSLDEVIALEAEKLAALKAHKRGLMQQLFPREGETTPRLRFPEFRDAGPWEMKRLGEIATISMGASPKSIAYNKNGIGLPLIQGNADIKDGLSAPKIFTSQITRECFVGDILLSVRAPVGTVARSVHNACIGRGIAALRVKRNNSQEFLYQLLLWYEPNWRNISQGGTFDSINSNDIKQLKISVPSLSEQQKIADCLSSLDEVIALEAEKLAALKAHKKGLTQQLFPQEVV